MCGVGGLWSLSPQACLPQDLSLLALGHRIRPLLPLSQSSSKAQAERSFHVFYELLAGLDPVERERLSLQEPETYHYLNQVGTRCIGCRRQGLPRERSRQRDLRGS